MKLEAITRTIIAEREQPLIDLWHDYDLSRIPLAIYDEAQVNYIGHPNPPEERPNNLMAATSTDINGTQTATIPNKFCPDEATAVAITYHEGFHVYQYHHFAPIMPDMFTAMAYYPELDLDYRVLCRLEAKVLKSDLTALQKLRHLTYLTGERRARLAHHKSLLPYERFLERSEGTARYVEQKSRLKRNGTAPEIPDVSHGWSRFYELGAAICWLLDEEVDDWKTRIEKGDSTGDIMLDTFEADASLAQFDPDGIRNEETETLKSLREAIDADINRLNQPDTLRIRYPVTGPVFRAFAPDTLTSLGDGRILHSVNFKLLLPDHGEVNVENALAIDDIANKQVLVNVGAFDLTDGVLTASTEHVTIKVSGVHQESERVLVIT